MSTSTAPTSALDLTALGNVPQTYRHEWRVSTPQSPIVIPGTPGSIFKWYHVHRDGVPVPEDLDALARKTITDAATAGKWDLSYGLNIAQIHVSTTHAFLIPGVWRGHQELWQRPYWLDLAKGGPFTRVDITGEDAPAACVWELGVICHERMAWHRYLFSARDDMAKHAWLTDTYAGPV
jgi:hypothetical protein